MRLLKNKNFKKCLGAAAHACNPRVLGVRDRSIPGTCWPDSLVKNKVESEKDVHLACNFSAVEAEAGGSLGLAEQPAEAN